MVNKSPEDALLSRLSYFQNSHVLVVGDIGIDEYVMGEVRRISPEAPVPVLEVKSEQSRLGLAANVAQNIVSLGGRVQLFSVVGADEGRDRICALLEKSGVSAEHLCVDVDRPTTRKLRVMAEHHHLVRVDYEHRKFLSPKVERDLLSRVHASVHKASAIVLQDYAKGVLSESCTQEVIALGREQGIPVLVDPNASTPCSHYRGATLMTPNRDEAFRLSGLNIDDLRESPRSVIEVGQALMNQIGSSKMIITRGKEGMTFFEEGGHEHLPTAALQVSDVTGAGDTVVAAIALSLGAGLTLRESCQIANSAAGIVVAKVGAATCTLEELRRVIEER